MHFFELLQIAIGNRDKFSQSPTEGEWRELFALAQKQAMVGIAFRGVEQLPETQRPPKALLMQWYAVTERIKAMNADLDRKALAVANKFLEDGFPGVVLKGQGIARLYRVERIGNCHPEASTTHHTLNTTQELKVYRTPGDIDIWLMGTRKEILDYVRRHVPDCKPVYHHVDFPVVEGLDIEVHFTPTWMNSPVTNRRLQKFFREQSSSSFSSSSKALPTPSLAFNRIYILVHIYRHLFAEGIGLRQLLDYYFVLCQGFTEEERKETVHTLRSLKMQRFAAAVMWVLQQVFGMDDRYLLTPPDEREGRFLLSEIMQAGNFGQHDERLQHIKGESRLHWGLRKVVRNFRFVRSYPSEVLWSPLFKLWQFFFFKG
jgi:hypothetical protein